MFRDIATVLNERKHLKIVFRSVSDSVILFLDRSDRPGLTALHHPLQFEIEVGEDSVHKLVALADLRDDGVSQECARMIYEYYGCNSTMENGDASHATPSTLWLNKLWN